ncbi:MAG: methyl-accepting chemotaxis protein [Desulfotomaculales bacterium]
MKVRWKILAGYLAVLAVFAGAVGVQDYQMRRIKESYARIVQEDSRKASEAQNFLVLFERMPVSLKDYLLSGNPADLKSYASREEQTTGQLQKLAGLAGTEKEKEVLARIQEKYGEFRKAAGYLAERRGQAAAIEEKLRGAASGQLSERERNELNGQLAGLQKEIVSFNADRQALVEETIKAGYDFIYLQEVNLKEKTNGAERLISAVGATSRAALVLAAVLGLLIAFFLSQLIAGPLALVERGVASIAEGELSLADIKGSSRDEIGSLARSFNRMKQGLKEIVGKVAEGAREVLKIAGQLSASASQTARGATTITSAVSQIAAAVEEGADNAVRVAKVAEKAANLAAEGNARIDRLVARIESIQASARQVNEAIVRLGETSFAITKIVQMITGIAEQTNLLALNAAIEAARAGEQGRGFAVVAEEVRKLSEESANAAKEIFQLLESIRASASEVNSVTGENVRKVEEGTLAAKEVGEFFSRIIGAVQELRERTQEVAAVAQQTAGSVENVAGTAEEQTAAMEEVAALAGGLQKFAAELEEMVARFRLGESKEEKSGREKEKEVENAKVYKQRRISHADSPTVS